MRLGRRADSGRTTPSPGSTSARRGCSRTCSPPQRILHSLENRRHDRYRSRCPLRAWPRAPHHSASATGDASSALFGSSSAGVLIERFRRLNESVSVTSTLTLSASTRCCRSRRVRMFDSPPPGLQYTHTATLTSGSRSQTPHARPHASQPASRPPTPHGMKRPKPRSSSSSSWRRP